MEVLLLDGSIVRARQGGENAELFHDLAGSYGTLGVVTLLDVKVVKARSYVELEYIPVYSVDQALQVLQKHQKAPNVNYIDALLFSPTVGRILMSASLRITESLRTKSPSSEGSSGRADSNTTEDEFWNGYDKATVDDA